MQKYIYQRTPKEEALHQIYKVSYHSILGQFLLLVIINIFFYKLVPLSTLAIGSSILLLVYTMRSYVTYLYMKEHHKYEANYNEKKWFFIFVSCIVISGVVWSSSLILLSYDSVPPHYAFFLLAVMIAFGGTAIATLGTDITIYLLFMVPILGSYFLWFALQEERMYQMSAILIAMIMLFYYVTVRRYRDFFYQSIEKRNSALNTQREMIERLSKASELKDNETGKHIQRVSYFSYCLAKEAGVSEFILDNIYLASAMHDAGKIGIPDHILLKKGKFTTEEWIEMQSHATIGKELLEGSESELIQLCESIAYTHHEQYDGSGYPQGLKGKEIPLEGRIVAIADVYDALRSKRPYKEPWSQEKTFKYLEEKAGKSFDPELIKHFINIKEDIIKYQERHKD
jgi:putative two-component system response regulator